VPNKHFPKHSASTIYLRVPRIDWPAVKLGLKTEFRGQGRFFPLLTNVDTPAPVVLWTALPHSDEPEMRMAVLEACWQEPLRMISPESLAREGFASFKEFKTYWRIHRAKNTGFKPMTAVWVYRVRPWRGDEDVAELGERMIRRLYGVALEAE
jgi:hypothetical protein